MAPWSCWSEWATGTNGMGTALEAPGPVLISGPRALVHGLSRVGLCRRGRSRRRDPRSRCGPRRLDLAPGSRLQAAVGCRAVGGARAILRQRARDSGAELAAAFADAARSGQALAALDASGKVVIADEARASSSASRRGCRHWTRPSAGGRAWTNVARHAIKQARLDHGWVGSTQIVTELSSEPCGSPCARLLADQPIGTLAIFGRNGDTDRARAAEPALSPRRASWA